MRKVLPGHRYLVGCVFPLLNQSSQFLFMMGCFSTASSKYGIETVKINETEQKLPAPFINRARSHQSVFTATLSRVGIYSNGDRRENRVLDAGFGHLPSRYSCHMIRFAVSEHRPVPAHSPSLES